MPLLYLASRLSAKNNRINETDQQVLARTCRKSQIAPDRAAQAVAPLLVAKRQTDDEEQSHNDKAGNNEG